MAKNNTISPLRNIIYKTVFTLISIGILTSMVVYLYKKEKYGTYSAFLNYEKYGQHICDLTLTRHFKIEKTPDNKFYMRISSLSDTTAFGYLYAKRNSIYLSDDKYTALEDSCLLKNFTLTFLEENNLIKEDEDSKNPEEDNQNNENNESSYRYNDSPVVSL